jgi:hypothetical protein
MIDPTAGAIPSSGAPIPAGAIDRSTIPSEQAIKDTLEAQQPTFPSERSDQRSIPSSDGEAPSPPSSVHRTSCFCGGAISTHLRCLHGGDSPTYAISKGGKIPLQGGNPVGHTNSAGYQVQRCDPLRQRLFSQRERPRIPPTPVLGPLHRRHHSLQHFFPFHQPTMVFFVPHIAFIEATHGPTTVHFQGWQHPRQTPASPPRVVTNRYKHKHLTGNQATADRCITSKGGTPGSNLLRSL